MKKVTILLGSILILSLLGLLFIRHTYIGIRLQILWQMISPPKDLFIRDEMLPVHADQQDYEFVTTNRFLGNYAVKLRIPSKKPAIDNDDFKPPHIQSVRYVFNDKEINQTPCKRDYYSLGEQFYFFTYEPICVPFDLPKDILIKIQVKFPQSSYKFFSNNPGCLLYYGKSSDE